MKIKPYCFQAAVTAGQTREKEASRLHMEVQMDLERARLELERHRASYRQSRLELQTVSRQLRIPPSGCSAADLHRQIDYLNRMREQGDITQTQVDDAIKRLRTSAEKARRSLSDLHQAYAHRKALDKHRQRFETEQSRASDLKSEREIEERSLADRNAT
jgi:hypothetical protein